MLYVVYEVTLFIRFFYTMCFSPEVSIGTFVLGFVSSVLVYSLGTIDDQIIGMYFAFISFIQWIEYLLWNHVKCDNYNRWVSFVGMLMNHLQPMVLGALVLGYHSKIAPKNRNFILGLLFIYTVSIVPYSLQFYSTNQCTVKTSDNHLYWTWNNMPMYSWVYSLFVLCIFSSFRFGLVSPVHGQYMAYTGLVLLGISGVIYHGTGIIGSMWCFFSAFVPLIWYLLRIYRIIV